MLTGVRPLMRFILGLSGGEEAGMSGAELQQRDRRRTGHASWAAAISAAAVVVVAVVIVVLVVRSGHGDAKSGPGVAANSESGNPSSPASASASHVASPDPLAGDVAAWADFPVHATPRPVVLTGQAIQDPRTGFRDGDSKEAYMEGRLTLAATLPGAPATLGGYMVSSAADAIHQIQTPDGTGPPVSMTLQITDVQLVEHPFATDRGERALPAWELKIAGVDYPAYVLAVAASERFDPVTGEGDGAVPLTLGGDGRELTLPFVARHTSTGPCDYGYTQTLKVSQTANAVVIDIETVMERPSAPPSPVGCADIAYGPRPDPGEPATKTVTLDDPLGARVVVNQHGVPLAVTS
jgi:hypothetical protein